MAFHRIGELRTSADDVVQFDANVDMFVNPPTLYISVEGIVEINLRDGKVTSNSRESDGTFFKLRGKLSDDRQTIRGHVDIQGFRLMDVAGDFFNSPIVLQISDNQDEI